MSTAKRYSLHQGFGYQLSLLGQINSRRMEAGLKQLGLTRMMWCVLLAVVEEGLVRPSEIAEFIGINRTAASRTLRQMETDGLILRKSGKNDQRNTTVHVTKKGHALLNNAIPHAQEVARHIRSKLTTSEAEKLQELLTKLMVGEARDVSSL